MPFFTLHNLKELMNTNNDQLRKQRLIQISSLDHFFNFINIQAPASALNIITYEFEYALNSDKRKFDFLDLKKYLYNKLEVKSGEQIIGKLDLSTKILNEFSSRQQEGIYFASLPAKIHHGNYDSSKLKLSDLNPYNFTDSEFMSQKEQIKNNFSNKGDKKKGYLINTIDSTLDSWYEQIKEIDKSDKIKYFAEIAGISPEEISLDMSFDTYVNIVEKNNKLREIASIMKIDYKNLLQVDIDLIPTFLLDRLFQNDYQKRILNDKPRHAESSIMEDKFLCYFSVYFEVIVDKRTAEVLNNIQNDLPFQLNYHINQI